MRSGTVGGPAAPAANVRSSVADDGRHVPGTTAGGVSALDMRGLVKLFGPVRAVAGVDLAVRRGEFLTLLGP